MRLRLLRIWDQLRTNYWFLPALMAASAATLALILLALDRALKGTVVEHWWAYTGGPDGARAVLSTIAGSMITVAGLVFSITIVTLALASSQFGPRLLRNFLRDTANQVVLGTFVATFLYCLLVLRTVRGPDGESFVPHTAVAMGVLLAIASLGVLIYFINHVAVAIQAPQVILAVSSDLLAAVDSMSRQGREEEAIEQGSAVPDMVLLQKLRREGGPILARRNGYLQILDYDYLVSIAREQDLVIEACFRPGHFIVQGCTVARVLPAEKVNESLTDAINRALVVGGERTPTQDPEFAVRQLVEVALRALSPGINDPFTAMTCIDWLGAALCRLTRRAIPHPCRYDADQTPRVVGVPLKFAGVADAAFNQIRQAGRANAAVTICLLETIAVVVAQAGRAEDRAVLARHALMVWRSSQDALPEEGDRKDADDRYQELQQRLKEVINEDQDRDVDHSAMKNGG
jgi:uncharacterized membrane protein